MGKGTAPPDPYQTADAQARYNQQSAVQNAALNRVNTNTPWGSQTYGITGYNADGTPIYEQSINLSGQMQDLFNREYDQNKELSRAGVDLAGQIRDRGAFSLGGNTPGLASNVQAGGVRNSASGGAMPKAGPIQQSVTNSGPKLQGQVGFQGQPIQSQYQSVDPQMSVSRSGLPALPTDLDKFRNEAEGALYDRNTAYLDQQYGRDEEGLRTRLANQGITEGSEAYSNAVDDFNRGKEMSYRQARNESIIGGGDEASRMFGIGSQARGQLYGEELTSGDFRNNAAAQATGQNLTAANFANQARGQGFGESLASGQFTNDARNQALAEALQTGAFGNQAQAQQWGQGMAGQSQRFDQSLANANLANQAQNQQFGQGMANAQLTNQARGQSVQEQLAQRNQPINELNAIRGLTQIQMPQFQGMSQVGTNPADITSAINNNYNAQVGTNNGLLGGLFGLGSAAISSLPASAWSFLSDENAKEDISQIGSMNDGTGVYLFKYKGDDTPQVGFMAGDVEGRTPEAVKMGSDGYRRVNYAKVIEKSMGVH